MIKLRTGYLWNCPTCGFRNVVEQFFRTLREPDENGLGHYECGPVREDTVFCERCESEFEIEKEPLSC